MPHRTRRNEDYVEEAVGSETGGSHRTDLLEEQVDDDNEESQGPGITFASPGERLSEEQLAMQLEQSEKRKWETVSLKQCVFPALPP